VSHLHAVLTNRDEHIQIGLAHVDANPTGFITHGTYSYYPALQNRALRPGNCSGCEEKTRTDPSSPTISRIWGQTVWCG